MSDLNAPESHADSGQEWDLNPEPLSYDTATQVGDVPITQKHRECDWKVPEGPAASPSFPAHLLIMPSALATCHCTCSLATCPSPPKWSRKLQALISAAYCFSAMLHFLLHGKFLNLAIF